MLEHRLSFGVFGAGSIGTYVGTLLATAGHRVVLLGRPPLVRSRHAIEAVVGRHMWFLPRTAIVTTDPRRLRDVDVCLVAVKSGDTDAAAAALSRGLKPSALVVSLQNGLFNCDRLRSVLAHRILPGIVGFNVCRNENTYRRTVAGPLVLSTADPRLATMAEALRLGGQKVSLRDDTRDVMAGKLLLNTNNGVCGATGLQIKSMMNSVDARRCFAACIVEGDRVLRAAGYKPRSVGLIGPLGVARLAKLGDWILRPMLAVAPIDPRADASTTVDLRRGRATEIEELNGAIVQIADRVGIAAPINRYITRMVQEVQRSVTRGDAPRWVDPAALRAACDHAAASSASGVALSKAPLSKASGR